MTDASDLYYAELASVEAEIREGFVSHFNGKPGATVPVLEFAGGHDQVQQQAARLAVAEALDYDDTDAAMHAMLCGQLPVERMQELLIARYIAANADDIVWARTGLTLPSKRTEFLGAKVPKFLIEGATA